MLVWRRKMNESYINRQNVVLKKESEFRKEDVV
jgi:hypothetical protein